MEEETDPLKPLKEFFAFLTILVFYVLTAGILGCVLIYLALGVLTPVYLLCWLGGTVSSVLVAEVVYRGHSDDEDETDD